MKSSRILVCALLVALIAVSTGACKSQQSPASVNDRGAGETQGTSVTTTTADLPQPSVSVSDEDIAEPEEIAPTTSVTPTEQPEVDKSEEIPEDNGSIAPTVPDNMAQRLFSISMGGGFGTLEDTATTTWTVYVDGTVDKAKLNRRTPAVKLSDEDFETLRSWWTPEKLESMVVEEDWGVLDGGGTYITLYDENGEVLIEKGGYSAKGEAYRKLFWDTYGIIDPYIPDWQ